MTAEGFLTELVSGISGWAEVVGIGQTGDAGALVPGGDVDLFVLCGAVPDAEARRGRYGAIPGWEDAKMEVSSGGAWGHGDVFSCCGVDIMPMFFSAREMEEDIRGILGGGRLGREGRYYPSGRLSSVESIHILYEEDRAWSRLAELVSARPQSLFEELFSYHIDRVLDEEDLSRASLRRDVFFYHQVLEEAIDHLLQALYALNGAYFPSRKRVAKYIAMFGAKPRDFEARLRAAIRDGAEEHSIPRSIESLRALTQETRDAGQPGTEATP